MTQEEKELLLKSLCETAQYGVNGLALGKKTDTIKTICLSEYPFIVTNGGLTCYVGEQFKPYLRPMSDMMEEEHQELSRLANDDKLFTGDPAKTICLHCGVVIDFHNSHHLDWRGLIEKGLALEAPEGMYNIK